MAVKSDRDLTAVFDRKFMKKAPGANAAPGNARSKTDPGGDVGDDLIMDSASVSPFGIVTDCLFAFGYQHGGGIRRAEPEEAKVPRGGYDAARGTGDTSCKIAAFRANINGVPDGFAFTQRDQVHLRCHGGKALVRHGIAKGRVNRDDAGKGRDGHVRFNFRRKGMRVDAAFC